MTQLNDLENGIAAIIAMSFRGDKNDYDTIIEWIYSEGPYPMLPLLDEIREAQSDRIINKAIKLIQK